VIILLERSVLACKSDEVNLKAVKKEELVFTFPL